MLRRYTKIDYSACMNILESNIPRYFLPQDREDFRLFLESPSGVYNVLEDHEGTIIGCGGIATRHQGEDGILTWGMIHAMRHRQGWGRRLTLARLAQLCALSSVKRITLHTSQESVGFYERLGFRTLAFTVDGYGAGLHRHDMQLIIDEPFCQQVSALLV
ncbi:acetyltransferase [Ktedonobacter sp. SOSP1-85]|nr:acetyltransferase [Ktedonobacter sp. SOSP1-85]